MGQIGHPEHVQMKDIAQKNTLLRWAGRLYTGRFDGNATEARIEIKSTPATTPRVAAVGTRK